MPGMSVDGAGYGLRREIGGRCSRFLAVPVGDCRPGEYRTGSVPYPDYGAGPAQTQPVVGAYLAILTWEYCRSLLSAVSRGISYTLAVATIIWSAGSR